MPTCKDVLLFFARCRQAAYDKAANLLPRAEIENGGAGSFHAKEIFSWKLFLWENE